jgi:hypothetical protein
MDERTAEFFRADSLKVTGVRIVRCPICNRTEHEVRMTDGHVHPKLVAGGGIVPECADCNGKLGSYADAALVSIVRDILLGTNQLPKSEFRRLPFKRATFNGTPVRAVRPDGTTNLSFHTPPDFVSPQEDSEGNVSFAIRSEGAHSNAILSGIFHSAHLKLFRELGHEYLRSSGAQALAGRLYSIVRANSAEARHAALSSWFNPCRFLVPMVLDVSVTYAFAASEGVRGFLAAIPLPANLMAVAVVPGMTMDDVSLHDSYNGRPFSMCGNVLPRRPRRNRSDLPIGAWIDSAASSTHAFAIDLGSMTSGFEATISSKVP